MAGDIYYPNVSLLLPCSGANGSTTLADLSLSPKSVTAFGGAQISNAQPLFGQNTLLLNGSSSYVEVGYTSDFAVGSGDFAVECLLFPTAAPTVLADLICTNRSATPSNGWSLRLRPGMNVIAGFSTNGTDYIGLEGSVVIPLNAWSYAKAGRVGNSLYLRVNGELAATGEITGSHFDTLGSVVIGRNPANSSWYFTGHIAQARFTKGAGRSAEPVPTGPFPNYAGQLIGNVKDAAAANAARTVRAYREDTAALVGSAVSDATTGTYTINAPIIGPHTLNAYPAAGENLPALTLRGVIPV